VSGRASRQGDASAANRALRAICLSLLVAAAGEGRAAETFGDLAVAVEPIPETRGYTESIHGYLEIQVVITNRSQERSHDVRLTIPARATDQPGHHIREITRGAAVGPKSTVRVFLYQPALTLSGSDMRIEIDGKAQRRPILLPASRHVRHYYHAGPCVLTSRSVGDAFPGWFAGEDSYRGAGRLQSESPVANWSPNWLGYCRYDGVVVTEPDVARMPVAVRQALRRYVECGGCLVVYGVSEVPGEFRSEAGSGDGRTHHIGFGCVTALSQRELTDASRRRLTSMINDSYAPWRSLRDAGDANEAFPIVEGLQVPIRGLFVLILLFGLAVGPVGIWLLSHWRKRIWLLWIVPSASVLTCAGVFVYALISEGLHGRVRVRTLTILDENARRATTIGWMAFYSPLTPGEGLRFGNETELSPQVTTGEMFHYPRRGMRGRGRTLHWSDHQHLASGWITARIPAHFMIRKSEQRRERVRVRKEDDGTLSAVNGLGADIRELYVGDEQARIWHAGAIAAGAETALSLVPGLKARDAPTHLRDVYYAQGWLTQARNVIEHPTAGVVKGCYLALLDRSPFLEPGLDAAEPRPDCSVVFGILKRGDDGS
jgi:hypothetical protein